MDAETKLERFRQAAALITDEHDRDEKIVRRNIASMRKIVDDLEAGIPEGRRKYQERMAAEAERKAKIKADAEAAAAKSDGQAA